MAAAPAITNAQVKNHIWGVATPPSTFDSFFTQTIPFVEKQVEQVTGIRFAADDTDYDEITNEIVDNNGDLIIEAKLKPIRTVTKIEYRDSNWDWTEQTDISDYNDLELEDNKIYTRNSVITGEGRRNLRLTYTVGYLQSNVPDDMKLCLILLVAGLWNQRSSVGFKSQSIMGQFQVQLSEQDYFVVKQTLTKYKNIVVL